MGGARRNDERAEGEARGNADASFRLSHLAHLENRLDDALAWLLNAAALAPENAHYHYTLGRLHKARNDWGAAERSYREALRLRPDHVDAWISLGILLRNLGRAAEAERCHRSALRIDPNNFLAVINLGNALISQDQFAAAADLARVHRNLFLQSADNARRALAANPGSAVAHYNLGRAVLYLSEQEAARHFRDALQINPSYFEAAESLGRCLSQLGACDEALAAFESASRLRPDSIETRLALAKTYRVVDRLEESAAEYASVLRIAPDLASAKGGMAGALADLGENERARRLFEEALAQEPDDAAIRLDYAILLMRNGEFADAWINYEARWRACTGRETVERAFAQPQWNGESLAGKCLLICCEQGLGDEIVFASVLPDVVREADHCIIECDHRLEALFRRSFSGATIFGVDRSKRDWHRALEQRLGQLPAFDYWIPAGSLPRHRRSSAEAFPSSAGYLAADPERVRHWRDRLQALGSGPKIGISWRGGTAITQGAARSLTLEQLRPVLATNDVHFVSLQYGDCRAERESFVSATGMSLHHWPDAIDRYDESAALIAALDLVVSVCTAVVPLGAALGRPVWAMTPMVADWRYGRSGASAIWFPGARIFRQPRRGAWVPVIAEVAAALRDYGGGKSENTSRTCFENTI